MAATTGGGRRKLAYGAAHRGNCSDSLDRIRVGYDLSQGSDAGGTQGNGQDANHLG